MLISLQLAILSCLLAFTQGNISLLFLTSKDIRTIHNVGNKPMKQNIIIRNLMDGCSMEYYHADNMVCWGDRIKMAISCQSLNISQSKNLLVSSGLLSPDGLACDWVTRKMYWTDGETNRIEVIELNGLNRKVLFWDNIDQPRAIALAPKRGLMFWTDWGDVSIIERAGMNGNHSSRTVIVSHDIFWPNGLTIDYDSETIYWTDGKLNFVAAMDYDGRNRRTIIEKIIQYPQSITFFKNKLYWSEWDQHTVQVYDMASDKEPKTLVNGTVSVLAPMSVLIMDGNRQPYVENPCRHKNGGCSHLCLLSPFPPGYSCACPTGIKKISDSTCADGVQELLLLVQRSEITNISLDTNDFYQTEIPLKGIKYAFAIDYDPVEKQIFWTDDETRVISRANLDGSDQKEIISTEISHPDGVAVDWVARNLYWTDTGTDRIEVARLSGACRKILINEDLAQPRAIALAPSFGLMFWSDWDDKHPKIERAALDGSQRVILVDTNLGWPNGIALDLESKTVYWCDAHKDIIEMINFDGSSRQKLMTDDLPHLFGLSLLGDYLYWTDWQRRVVEKAHKITGHGRTIIADNLPNLMGVKAVKINGFLPGTNACADRNGGCSDLCLNRPDDYICACPYGFELSHDNRTCVEPEAFLILAKKDKIFRISIENYNNDVIFAISGIENATALDFVLRDLKIYWTDVQMKAIFKAYMNGSNVEKIIEYGLDQPEGLAVDWVAHNIYWVDTGKKTIEVSRLDGSSRRVLVWENIDEPRSLALNPRDGYMYWSDWRKPGRIERTFMDGSIRETILNNIGRTNGLTVDFVDNLLFWAALDTSAIECSELSGRNKRVIINTDMKTPFGLTQYQDFVYWTDWITGEISRANKKTGLNRTKIHEKLERVTDIHIFHASRQSDWNQCEVSNGKCSHLCLVQPEQESSALKARTAYVCSCPTHYTLVNNTCVPPLNFLLYSQKNAIVRLSPNQYEYPFVQMPIPSLRNVRALEFDPLSQWIYWVDGKNPTIKKVLSNGKNLTFVIPPEEKTFPFDLAVDPYSGFIFWTCSESNSINVTRSDGIYVGTVVKVENEKPRYLAIHSKRGLLFWTDHGSVPRIKRARLDGHNTLVIATGLNNLTGLAVDSEADLIFYAYQEFIFSNDLVGSKPYQLASGIHQLAGLAVLENFIYYVDSFHQYIKRIHKLRAGEQEVIIARQIYMTDIVAVHTPLPEDPNPCVDGGGCSHICVLGENKSPLCLCPQGLSLGEDRRNCEDAVEFDKDSFICQNSEQSVIPTAWICDGQVDCDDQSDEFNCPSCRPDEFSCQGAFCISKLKRCDGVPHCPNALDETDCCPDGGFRCDTACIDHQHMCDGVANCADGSDEAIHNCPMKSAPKSTSATVYILGLFFGLIATVAISSIVSYLRCRCPTNNSANASRPDVLEATNPLTPKPRVHKVPQQPTPLSKHNRKMGGVRPGSEAVRMSALSYDRSRLTGASSSGGSSSTPSGAGYPQETLNPPPSPVTDPRSVCVESHCCSAYSGMSSRRPYRHYRSINKPPPPTPCSTDVCDESDSYAYTNSKRSSEYDSDPLPPPPTPRSHYTSDMSYPSSPYTERSYFNPLPPPPSPDHSPS
ncbi:Hypothetical predicted protein [Cloeon dipterum]|uniref:EGF-like domain-containing protein n=1 Tax=Cloeon dipterum TaxID=197152 RepID=A0A8S1CE67_9INSE|nr:Hypothetical predicted protein [Cloeon dipterum]